MFVFQWLFESALVNNRSYLSLLSVDSIDLLSVREPRKGEWVHRSKFFMNAGQSSKNAVRQ